jgi:hypothetical protein
MAQAPISSQNTDMEVSQPAGPPMPKAFYHVVNPVMKGLLRSPLHGLLSKSLMLLIYEGRKSRKRYIIPVGYVERDGRLYVFTHSAWYKNFIGGAPVALRLRGELVRGTTTVVDDPQIIRGVAQQVIADRGEAMADRMGLLAVANAGDDAPAPQGIKFMEIVLEGAR